MVSGSAALPEPIMKTWQEITGWDQVKLHHIVFKS